MAKTTTKTSTAKKSTSTKSTAASSKSSTAKKSTSSSKSSTAKKTTTAKKNTSSGTSMKLTAAEKTLVELYRAADTETKKAATKLLKEQKSDLEKMVSSVLNNKDVKKVVSSFLK